MLAAKSSACATARLGHPFRPIHPSSLCNKRRNITRPARPKPQKGPCTRDPKRSDRIGQLLRRVTASPLPSQERKETTQARTEGERRRENRIRGLLGLFLARGDLPSTLEPFYARHTSSDLYPSLVSLRRSPRIFGLHLLLCALPQPWLGHSTSPHRFVSRGA